MNVFDRRRPVPRDALQRPLADVLNELVISLAQGKPLSAADNARVTRLYTELSKLDERNSR